MADNSKNTWRWKPPRLRVALIAHDESGRVLLLQHDRPHGKYWVLPGGGVDPGETVEDALKREIREELDVECSIDHLAAIGEFITGERHVVDFFFRGDMATKGPYKVKYEEGISDCRWVDRDEAEGLKILPDEIRDVIFESGNDGSPGIRYLGKYKIEGNNYP